MQKVQLSENARIVLETRYLAKNKNSKTLETPETMFARVAREVAKPEGKERAKYQKLFYGLMASLRFLPNSPTLMNAGLDNGGTFSACYVLPIEDSIDGIFDAVKNAAKVHKFGGGTGFGFSRLRAKNSIVASTSGVASGPVSFMRIFNTATEQIKQGSKRRGANMAVLRVDHPDIIEFITAKDDLAEFNNFNISVAITDKFMQALKKGKNYDIIDPLTGSVKKGAKGVPVRLNAKEVWDLIITRAHATGEPGLIFIDRINERHPVKLDPIESCNPCGEQPLRNYESCNLGSINLSKYVIEGSIDRVRLMNDVKLAVRFLDNVVTQNQYPLPRIKEETERTRKIGLGIMGWADTLAMLGIPYDSDEALALADDIWDKIYMWAYHASADLARERGTFPEILHSIYAGRAGQPRNACLTSIAPTGSISIIAGCSSGIEPIFALAFTRNVLGGKKLVEVHPIFKRVMEERGLWTAELEQKVTEAGSIQHFDGIPDDIKRLFVSSHDVAPEWHVRMQAAFQKYSDSGVSKTVNLPNSATVEDVRQIFSQAYELGCIGITVYRDGSRQGQALQTGKAQPAAPEASDKKKPRLRKRPRRTAGLTFKYKTHLGKLFVTVNFNDEKEPVELIANIGKSGQDVNAMTEAIGRVISVALKFGVPYDAIVKQLVGISGAGVAWDAGKRVISVPDGIGQAMTEAIGSQVSDKKNNELTDDDDGDGVAIDIGGNTCPMCGGSNIEISGGCPVCHDCHWSKCK